MVTKFRQSDLFDYFCWLHAYGTEAVCGKLTIMGFNFSFFGKQEVRGFNYRPRFYDPEAEERRKKYGDFTKKDEPYVPGTHIKGSFRDGGYQKKKDMSRNQKAIGVITMILLFAVIYLIYEYYPILLQALGQ